MSGSFDPDYMADPSAPGCLSLAAPPASSAAAGVIADGTMELEQGSLQQQQLFQYGMEQLHRDWAAAGADMDMQNMGFNHHHHHYHSQHQQSQDVEAFPSPELLDLFAGSVSTAVPASTVMYGSMFHFNLPLQPQPFQSLSAAMISGETFLGGTATAEVGMGSGGLLGSGDYGDEDVDVSGGSFDINEVLELNREVVCDASKGRNRKKAPSEKQRRVHLSANYQILRDIVPNHTKTDRASLLDDAIEYIKELHGTVNEFKILVEKKRCTSERKRHKASGSSSTVLDNMESSPSPLRSSWLQRKSRETEVDVRIVEDEVTIKLIQRRRSNCLVRMSKILEELQLDLHHIAGGCIGDHYSFLFNTKIYEGSCVYASEIANKVIEAADFHSIDY